MKCKTRHSAHSAHPAHSAYIYIYIDVAKIIAGKLSAAQTGVENDSLSHHKNKSTFGASGDPKSRAA